MNSTSCKSEKGFKGIFVKVPLDLDLPSGWTKKVYQLNDRLVHRWTIWYDEEGNRFVNKDRIKERLEIEKKLSNADLEDGNDKDNIIEEEDAAVLNERETTESNQKDISRKDDKQEHLVDQINTKTLKNYLDFDPQLEKELIIEHLGNKSDEDDIFDVDDDKSLFSSSDQIISFYQQQEDFNKIGINVVDDTKNILERYREVIEEDTKEGSSKAKGNTNTIKCKMCGETFEKRGQLVRHMRQHRETFKTTRGF